MIDIDDILNGLYGPIIKKHVFSQIIKSWNVSALEEKLLVLHIKREDGGRPVLYDGELKGVVYVAEDTDSGEYGLRIIFKLLTLE